MSQKPTTPPASEAPLFREFEHTGDTGIELTAATRGELFRHAVLALAALLVDTGGIQTAEERAVSVEAGSDVDLMHDLLSELLYIFTAEGFIWHEASVTEDGRSLKVLLCGEPFTPSRHPFYGEIKAVTYHQLTVNGSPEGWYGRIIFDL
jgi:SHS2 domain-containing protein